MKRLACPDGSKKECVGVWEFPPTLLSDVCTVPTPRMPFSTDVKKPSKYMSPEDHQLYNAIAFLSIVTLGHTSRSIQNIDFTLPGALEGSSVLFPTIVNVRCTP